MSNTKSKLSSHLNTNQAKRERMCLELLQVREDFTHVTPRLPEGGRDGGRDIEAFYLEDTRVFGAVGFCNDATRADRASAEKKFGDDLKNVTKFNGTNPEQKVVGFVFFTNVPLTPKIIENLKRRAAKAGMDVCKIFDQEQMRIMLDKSSGYAIRLRYLDISLSDAEQKEFFEKWGDKVQRAMTSGLSEIGDVSNRLLFLAEAQFLVDTISVHVKLKRPLKEISGGDFAFETHITLRTHVNGLMSFVFGSASEPINTVQSDDTRHSQFGYSYVYLIPESETFKNIADGLKPRTNSQNEKYFEGISSVGFLDIGKSTIGMEYGCEPFFHRFSPTCKLSDLNRCFILFKCPTDIGKQIEEIVVIADGYELMAKGSKNYQLEIVEGLEFLLPPDKILPAKFSEFCKIRPSSGSSAFSPDFSGRTPRRRYKIKSASLD